MIGLQRDLRGPAASEQAVIPLWGNRWLILYNCQEEADPGEGGRMDWKVLGLNFCSSLWTAALLVVRGLQRETELKLDEALSLSYESED